jgi:hypothetical protein
MRMISMFLVAGLTAMAVPFGAVAGEGSDVVRIFGRDPGDGAAHACFVRRYTKAHLKSHPDQNVTTMLAYVGKQEGSDRYYAISLQVNFRQLNKPFQISGGCSESADTGALGCGVECDGGRLSVRVKNDQSILVEIPHSVRIFDPSSADEMDGLPQAARFGADDKLFRLDRTALSDCVPIIYDEEIKAKVISGAITQ